MQVGKQIGVEEEKEIRCLFKYTCKSVSRARMLGICHTWLPVRGKDSVLPSNHIVVCLLSSLHVC